MAHASKSARSLATIVVRRAPRLPGDMGPRGHVKLGTVTVACALGASGLTHMKREGDRAGPYGTFALLHGYFRADRLPRPRCRTALRPIGRDLGWCDDPAAPLYNRPGPVTMTAAHETMWRTDGLYDVVFVLDYNIKPRRIGRGSAIFLHCAKPGLPPTLGCIALRPDDLRRLLPRLARNAVVRVI